MEQQYREEHFMLEAEGYQLPAALTLPQGQDVSWGVVLIPGSMGSDVDGNYPEMQWMRSRRKHIESSHGSNI